MLDFRPEPLQILQVTPNFQIIFEMAPRGTKRKSDETTPDNVEDAQVMALQTVATKMGSPSGQVNPRKKQRTGISLSQKQALIDNLQLESMWPRFTHTFNA